MGVPKKKKRWADDGRRGEIRPSKKKKEDGRPKKKKRWGNAHLFQVNFWRPSFAYPQQGSFAKINHSYYRLCLLSMDVLLVLMISFIRVLLFLPKNITYSKLPYYIEVSNNSVKMRNYPIIYEFNDYFKTKIKVVPLCFFSKFADLLNFEKLALGWTV